MRESVAVILAACLGYALALWLHDLPKAPTVPAPEPPAQADPVPAPTPVAQPEKTAPEPHHPDPAVRAAIRGLSRSLRAARLALAEQLLLQRGWRRFEHEIPEDVAYRGHDFLRAVAAATAQRWFAPAERAAFERARDAWNETIAHRDRLSRDHSYRAAEQRLANLAHDPWFKGLHLLSHSSPPFLFVYASRGPLSHWELKKEQRTPDVLAEISRRQTLAWRLLRRNAAVAQATRRALRSRYAQPLEIPELAALYGGRADYAHGVRSFADGVVLLSVTFADRAVVRDTLGAELWSLYEGSPWQGFQPGTGMIMGLPHVDEEITSPFWSTWYGRETADQLLHWYTRQRNRWRKPRPGQGFLHVGIAAWLGAVQIDPRGPAVWSGVAGRRLQDMQNKRRELKRMGNEYELFPIRELVSFSSAGQIQAWGAQTWHLEPRRVLAMFREQAWALAHFLNRKEGPHAEAFQKFLQRVLHRETGGQLGERAFAEAFRLQDPDDWRELDRAFAKHVRELMALNPLPYLRDPPKLEAWAGK